jgi:hypothetical protein
MPALRTLGILILSLMAVAIGIFGYFFIKSVSDQMTARESAMRIAHTCQLVIEAGGRQSVDVYIPGDFSLIFQENRITVNGASFPEEGLRLPFAGNYVIGPGTHTVRVWENNMRLVVEWT